MFSHNDSQRVNHSHEMSISETRSRNTISLNHRRRRNRCLLIMISATAFSGVVEAFSATGPAAISSTVSSTTSPSSSLSSLNLMTGNNASGGNDDAICKTESNSINGKRRRTTRASSSSLHVSAAPLAPPAAEVTAAASPETSSFSVVYPNHGDDILRQRNGAKRMVRRPKSHGSKRSGNNAVLKLAKKKTKAAVNGVIPTTSSSKPSVPRLVPTSRRNSSNTAKKAQEKASQRKKQHIGVYQASNIALLTAEEEIELTGDLRTLRTVMRVREELEATTTDDFEATFGHHYHHLHHHGSKQMLSSSSDFLSYLTPTSEEEWAKACGTTVIQLRRIIQEGQEAKSRLISANIGLVTVIAKRQYYSLKQATEAGGGVGTILSLQDMIQEGNLGLIEAAGRFDPDRGARFGTYATWWVRQRILRCISDQSRIIRLPAHVHSMLIKISRARKEMKRQIGRDPSSPELAHYLEISVEKLDMYTSSSRNVISLESPWSVGEKGSSAVGGSVEGEQGGGGAGRRVSGSRSRGQGSGSAGSAGSPKEDRRTLGDSIASDAPTPEEDAHAQSLRQEIRLVIDTELATKEEKDVVITRFGLDNGEPRTVTETAKQLGMTRDRVRTVEARALNKLRSPQRNYRLKDYYYEGSAPDRSVNTASTPFAPNAAAFGAGSGSSSSSSVGIRNHQHLGIKRHEHPFENIAVSYDDDKPSSTEKVSSIPEKIWFF